MLYNRKRMKHKLKNLLMMAIAFSMSIAKLEAFFNATPNLLHLL